jgi:hypothetical protein
MSFTFDKEIRTGARKHDRAINELLNFAGAMSYWQLMDGLCLRGSTAYDIIDRMRREREVEVVKLEERGFCSQGVIVPAGMATRWDTCQVQLLDTRLQLDELHAGWTWTERDYHWERSKGGYSVFVVSAQRRDSRRGTQGLERIRATGADEETIIIYSDPDTERAAAVRGLLEQQLPELQVHQARNFRHRGNPRRRTDGQNACLVHT